MPFPRHPKSVECATVEAFMQDDSETELVLQYSSDAVRKSKHSLINNIITRNGFPLVMHGEADRITLTKIPKVVK